MQAKAWLSAIRLRTLPLALSCIGMGGFLAAGEGKFNSSIFALCCLTTIFLQILSNLANDYGDSVNGADHEGRQGPARAVQSGAISPDQMKRAVTLFIFLSLASGVSLLWISLAWDWQTLIVFFGLGILSIAAAVAYTVGKRPYGYSGLGDVSVLIFFGLVGVMGSLYLFTHSVSLLNVLPALSCGFFSMAVLNINNVRDIESDKIAGKYSIPVRIGKENAARYHWFLLAAGLASTIIYTAGAFHTPLQLLFLLVTPLLFINGRAVATKPSAELDSYLRQMAMTTLLFVILFGIGNLL